MIMSYYYESKLLKETDFQEAKFGLEDTILKTVLYVGCFNMQLCYNEC